MTKQQLYAHDMINVIPVKEKITAEYSCRGRINIYYKVLIP